MISHVQTGGAGSGTAVQEFIAISNIASHDVDVSSWCLKYADYTYTSISDLYCFEVAINADEVHMPSRSTIVIASPSYAGQPVTGQYKSASSSLSGTRGHIFLTNKTGDIVDMLAWDNKASTPPLKPETLSATAPAGGSMLKRIQVDGTYIDTDNNALDFSTMTSALPAITSLIDYSKLIEIIDLCGSLAGIQQTMPEGYGMDEAGNCELLSNDICMNIDKVQLLMPEGFLADEVGNCYGSSLDKCVNLPGFQHDAPLGYRQVHRSSCKLIVPKAKLRITELLPNVSGVDTSKEFIELLNRDATDVDVSDYYLLIGKNLEKQIELPNVRMAAGEYRAWYDTDLDFTLLNSTTNIQLVFYTGEVIDAIIPYDSPQDDIAWAYVDGVWQYTNNITPNQQNIAASETLGESTDNPPLAPCPTGKYRNPLTNRCRNIEDDINVLASCDADEYRNPETNRCRKIASTVSTLIPCEDGYERNPDTNRCRKIDQSAVLGACNEGYERNPETNRCRKALESMQTLANAAEEMTSTQASTFSAYPLVATAAAGGIAYGMYEWRVEMGATVRRILSYFIKK